MSDNPFEGLTIERSDALPKRLVAGRESIPNPFMEAVHDSYAESLDPAVGPDKAVRQILVPVKASECTVKEQTRKTKGKDGKVTESKVQWQAHPNITTALYLLRQAALKQDIGVRIVVDYDGDHNFVVKGGKVRVRFLGTKKKEAKKEQTPAQSAA